MNDLLLQQSSRSFTLTILYCLNSVLCEGCVILPITLSSLCNFTLSTISSEAPEQSLDWSQFGSLARMLLPQQMASKKIALYIKDIQKKCNILLQTFKDLSSLKKQNPVCCSGTDFTTATSSISVCNTSHTAVEFKLCLMHWRY